jgi:1,4-dihydroxy-2-naphthoate octaprenyltransferase
MGTYIAGQYADSSWSVLYLALLTAVFLQILSNLANDYGDYSKGTDNDNRIGNLRALQSGNIKPGQMKAAIVICVLLCLISGIALLWNAFSATFNWPFLIFFIIGVLAILAAIKYTIGKNPYGYSGFGDLMVFIFFGPVAVSGTYFLHTGFEVDLSRDWHIIFPGIAIGCLCTGVLNTNNIRDIDNDKASGKLTIPVKIGLTKARIYHAFLLILACLATVTLIWTGPANPLSWLSLIAFFPIFSQLNQVIRIAPSHAFNQLLKQLSLGTLLLVILLILTEIAGQFIQVSQILNKDHAFILF